MVALAGYKDFTQIHANANSQVYRARRTDDGQPVILKFLNRDYPTPEQIRRYRQEYHLTCQLNSPGIIKAYQLEEWHRSYAIVLEDFGAISLKQWLEEQETLPLQEFLCLAIAITESLGQIHNQQIIHKDINPRNIVFNPETQALKIIDFGISTQLSREKPTLKNPNVLEGTLAYISPEQTGRMNRGLDYRSDFYSLGVTFYEMLTGTLPFDSADPLELVHSHIARETPTDRFEGMGNREPGTGNRGNVPVVLVEIVLKLMAKNAEDRYQSAAGLKADLEICRHQFEATGRIAPFPLGQQDISDRFQIPQKLYGREEEIAALLAAFERVAATGTVELMLVTGYAGIGKSSLVQELYKPITARRGYFIAGKFDQFQRNIPYSAIVNAFSGLIEQLLAESEDELQCWREKLLQALGNNGQIIVDVIPAVELIIGPQPDVPVVGANEAQRRFNFVFGNFIRVFCSSDRPLTLFLDDLQWADLATLQLVERLLGEGQSRYLFLLGAYRDNEVSAGHLLAMTLDQLRQSDGAVHQIALTPLPSDQTARLIGDTLQRDPANIDDLTRLVWEKTAGNPFFLNEFLQALYDEKLLQFHRQARGWQWDLAAIQARNLTDNVVALMVEKLQKLPPPVQEILSLAACWGAEFDLTLLTWVEQKLPQAIFERLKIALNRGLIFSVSEPDENLLIQSYKFGHDRIQQAAYTLIPAAQRSERHAAIGRILLERIPEREREDQLFDVVDQLNRGIEQINEADEREQLARLNLQAGRKASESNAYAAAIAYLNTGISLLAADSWQQQYDLTFNLYQAAAQAMYLNVEIESMTALMETMDREAKTPLDRLKLGKLKVDIYNTQGRFAAALTAGLASLAAQGIEFPQPASLADFAPAHARVKTLMGDRRPADLARLPALQDPLVREVLTLLENTIAAAYTFDPSLIPLIACKQLELTITYGNAPISSTVYVAYGLVLCGILEEFSLGYDYGQLALTNLARFNDKQYESTTLMSIHSAIDPWTTHLKVNLQPLQRAFRVGLETGSLIGAVGANHAYCLFLYLIGWELAEVEQELERSYAIVATLGQDPILNDYNPLRQAILNLRGQSPQPHRLAGKVMDESALIADYQNTEHGTGLWVLYAIKATLCYLFEVFDEALAADLSAQPYIAAAIGHPLIPTWIFYSSLVRLALVGNGEREMENGERGTGNGEWGIGNGEDGSESQHLDCVRDNQAKLKRWADAAPMNHLHKFYLVAAEYQRVLGEKAKALEFYSLAIAGAKEHEYLQEEALANELAAKFYLDWGGHETAARAYMTEAHYCYTRWGATAKVKQLEERYPQLCRSSTPQTTAASLNNSRTTSNSTSDSTEGTALDLAAVMKSANAVSSEIVLDRLLEKLMRIALEDAGAQKGFLLLPALNEARTLAIEAEGTVDPDTIRVLQSTPIDTLDPTTQQPRLCTAILNYVTRTQESVVLNDAVNEGQFTHDPYITTVQPQSILCTPLLNQGQLSGILYLENNLTTGAFTEDRIEVLNILSSQAAISIENSRLYRTLEQKVEERTKELSQTLGVLKATQAELVLENALLRSDDQAQAYAYQVGGSLPLDAPTYVVRSADRYLYKALRQGTPCYVLNARQMGKSSLMVRMMHHLRQDGHRCAILDMTLLGSDGVTPEQWYKGLATELWQALGLTDSIHLGAWWKERQDLPVVQRLSQFFEAAIAALAEELEQHDRRLVVFLDEVDAVLSLHFPVNDFFASLRALHNRRAANPIYKRLTFALFGVVAPADLITDRRRTPFNIGQPIELSGFQPHEAQPLSQGLSEKVENPQVVLNEVLSWTGGQPFLTQKLCQMIRESSATIPINTEAEWVETLVRTRILEQWESQDEPQHLKTIRDRILESDRASYLLALYQQILEQREVAATDSNEERELLLSGIVVKQLGQLKIYNRIYQSVFNLAWVEAQLEQISNLG